MDSRLPNETDRDAFRREVLEGLGADAAEIEALLAYNHNVFQPSFELKAYGLPLPDEPFVEVWESYSSVAAIEGALSVLQDVLIQLRFPIREGMSEDDAYRAATRRGVWPAGGGAGIQLEQPAGLQIRMEETQAGCIPIIVTSVRADFEVLVRALTARNEPVSIPRPVNAFMVSGYNNWDRVMRHRQRWSALDNDGDWPSEFRRLADRKSLYQDRFIIVCTGPYSGIDAKTLGLDSQRWDELSLQIRITHESTHYFTRRAFGSMRNNLLDELIADYAGLVAALGRFRSDWFLRFMGLEDYPAYRAGGRLDAYRGSPPLSGEAFTVLQSVVVEAAAAVETIDRELPEVDRHEYEGRLIRALTCLTLEELASAQGAELLRLVMPAGNNAL